MRKILLVAFIICPILLMIVVNESSAISPHTYNPEKCTRFCHDQECRHFAKSREEKSISPMLINLYEKNILWLRNNGLGLSYQEMNLLIYVLIIPVLLVVLLWGMLRKPNLKND